MMRTLSLLFAVCTAVPAQEWPALKDPDKEKVLAMVAQFRKDAKLHAAATDALVKVGAGAAPLLLGQLTDKHPNVNAQVTATLDRILQPEHAPLLARETRKPTVELRRYAVLRLCRWGQPEMAPVFTAATKDNDEDVAFAASVGLCAAGKLEGLPGVLQRAKSDWLSIVELCAETLPKGRSANMGTELLSLMAKSPAPEQAAQLRLFRYLAIKEQAGALKGRLDAEDNSVKKETVNALRALHGEQPKEDLSVFQVIGMAKEWKQKL